MLALSFCNSFQFQSIAFNASIFLAYICFQITPATIFIVELLKTSLETYGAKNFAKESTFLPNIRCFKNSVFVPGQY